MKHWIKQAPSAIATIAVALWSAAATANPPTGGPEAPPRPPLPRITELRLEPAALTLDGARDERHALVFGKSESGDWIDLTDDATWKIEGAAVALRSDGYLAPVKAGRAEARVEAAGLSVSLPIEVKSADAGSVGFVREIMPVMSKVGCNSGTCHGSAKGKNGFKLSLRGYDADYDYRALVDDLSGRRFNRPAPDESLMLRKPLGEVPHEGGALFKPGSDYHRLMRQWIAEGALPEDHAARATSIQIVPAEVNLALPGMSQRVIVVANYADGSTRDVTREAVFSCSQIDIAKTEEDKITGLRRGEAAVLVRYEGSYATAPVVIMGDRSGFEWAQPEQFGEIDKLIDAKLKKMKILPAGLCSDADFIRRASLDLIGMPPEPEKARAFLADPAPSREKRARLVDDLIASAEFNDYWTNKWADLLQCNSEALGEKGVWVFRQWIHDSISSNKPYDKFVRELLTAQGSAWKSPEANYYRALREPGKITEDVSQTFLGVRFNCAKCHDHPFERWTQTQYYEFGAFFARLSIKPGTLPGEEIVYRKYDGGEVTHPKTGMVMAPLPPFGNIEGAITDTVDRREKFVGWLTSAENPLFAKAMSNRVWSYFFGRGIIEPVDDIRSSNPPSNPELLDYLTKRFIESEFNVRELMREICASRAYQSSIVGSKWNEDDTVNFSKQTARRLTAEQLLDAISVATGAPTKLPGLPKGLRAAQVADGLVEGSDFLKLFGRPKRQSACECERTSSVSLAHALNLINGKTIGDALASPENRIAKLVEQTKDPKQVVEEIYLATLSRPPSEKEIEAIDLASAPNLAEGAQDLAWALMNSPAFLYNR